MTSPADQLANFIEKRVIPCADPDKQAELLGRFREKLRRAFNQTIAPRGTNWNNWSTNGRALKLWVRQLLLEIQPPARRALYNDEVWELVEKFEAEWKLERSRQRRELDWRNRNL